MVSNAVATTAVQPAGTQPFVLGLAQLMLPLPLSPQEAPLGRVWLLAAEQSDAAQIAEHLSSDDPNGHSGFFVSVFDGSYAVGAGDLLALRSGPSVRIFLCGSAGSSATDALATTHARRAFHASEHNPVAAASAAEILFVRLVGNGQPLPGRNVDGMLARMLRSLQEADQARDARFVAEISAQLLARMPKAASGAIAGVLQRLRAGALFTLCRSIFGYSSEMLPEAIELYRKAGETFDHAALRAQGAACHRYARSLEALAHRASGAEPTLPGIVADMAAEPVIPRLAFRALRCLAIPVGHHPHSNPEPANALAFREVGSLTIADGTMRRILDAVTSLNVVPRIKVTRPLGRKATRHLSVAFDREHFAMLGLVDTRGDEDGQTYTVIVQGDGWTVSPPQQDARSGGSARFVARSANPTPEPLQVVIAAGVDVGTFVVPMP